MATHDLENESLGQKHKKYNVLLKKALSDKVTQQPITSDVNDLDNLLKIDIACSTRNVEYVLDVFKSNDMLYVSRAIKGSTWLITDNEYASIINVDYLNTELFPHMMTKSINKLMLKIRLNLRDEKRIEEFLNHEKAIDPIRALKWLQYCSIDFIEKVLSNLTCDIPLHIFKRLREKSMTVLKASEQNKHIDLYCKLNPTLFYFKRDPIKYLDIFDSISSSRYVQFGAKYTNVVMKSLRDKILNNFERYAQCIHCPTFVKYLNSDEIKTFLSEHSKNKSLNYFFNYHNLKHFIYRLNEDNRFDCLKKTLIDKIPTEGCFDCNMYSSVINNDYCNLKPYEWYEFAPFAVAFNDLTKLLRLESSPNERNAILLILINHSGLNPTNSQMLLEYYHNKHINEPLKFKITFVDAFLNKININVNNTMWIILNRLFHSMEVYTERDNTNLRNCLHAIIVHNAIVGQKNPESIEKKFDFNTCKNFRRKLNDQEEEKVFQYLYNYCINKIENKEIITESDYIEVLQIVTNILQLFIDWGKELQNYPFVLNKIKELTTVKEKYHWSRDLAKLYNLKKTWRKYMFGESFILSTSEEVCINALKHDPGLLMRYKDEVFKTDNLNLKNILGKIRVYWSDSLTPKLLNMCLESLQNARGHTIFIRALIALLPHEQLLNIIKKYAPEDTKIDWDKHDEGTLSIQKSFASNLHLSRKLIPLDEVLLYAKGDYLQYTVPSLCSTLQNKSFTQSYQYIPQILKSPISLQKYGIRYGIIKIPTNALIPMFLDVWKTTKNPSIRTVLFEQTHRAMCKSKNSEDAEKMWSLLSIFIDNLTSEENSSIYKALEQVQSVPTHIAGKFLMKSYTFLKSLPQKSNCENIIQRLINNMTQYMVLLDDDFILYLLKDVGETFKDRCSFLCVISSSLLFCDDEEIQHKRFESILAPLLDQYLPGINTHLAQFIWNEEYNEQQYISNNFRKLFKNLCRELKKSILIKKHVIPVKLFKNILTRLEAHLVKIESYSVLTKWKLMVSIVTLFEQHKSILSVDTEEQSNIDNKVKWDDIFSTIFPSFSKTCFDILKEDTRENSHVFYIFSEVLLDTLNDLDCSNQMKFIKCMLENSTSPEDYLLVIHMLPLFPQTCERGIYREVLDLMNNSVPAELKVHYYYKICKLETSTMQYI